MIHRLQVTILFLAVPLLALLAYAEYKNISLRDLFSRQYPVIQIDGIPVPVEVVQTPEERSRGLSDRDEVPASGMFFIFDSSDLHGIWMKDMKFPIDIVWISDDLRVVHIERSVRPDSYPRTFRPSVPARFVLETKEFFTDTFGISMGDKVLIPREIQDRIYSVQ